MKYSLLLAKAIAIASEVFKDCTDKGGTPYILHCLYVMHKVKHLGYLAMICAVLHDLVEDLEESHGWTFERLKQEGFTDEMITILKLLTHNPKDEYMEYIKPIAGNAIAKAIKMADIEHNSKITRLKGLRKKDFDNLEKYMRAYEYLKD